MPTLLLRFAAPLQAWGDESRFTRRMTHRHPTKSATVGMLAAALGRARTDDVGDLVALRWGTRIDQPGDIVRDFQVAIRPARGKHGPQSMPVSDRYYLEDAVFVVGLEGARSALEQLEIALRAPVYPLFLGRRSCPPTGRLVLGLRDTDLEASIRAEPWHAAAWHRRQQPQTVQLAVLLDAPADVDDGETLRDVPVSFSPVRREYSWRRVIRPRPVHLENPQGRPGEVGPDFFTAVTEG